MGVQVGGWMSVQEARGPKRPPEAPGGPRTPQEAPMRPQEAPGDPRRSPGSTRMTPRASKMHPEGFQNETQCAKVDFAKYALLLGREHTFSRVEGPSRHQDGPEGPRRASGKCVTIGQI